MTSGEFRRTFASKIESYSFANCLKKHDNIFTIPGSFLIPMAKSQQTSSFFRRSIPLSDIKIEKKEGPVQDPRYLCLGGERNPSYKTSLFPNPNITFSLNYEREVIRKSFLNNNTLFVGDFQIQKDGKIQIELIQGKYQDYINVGKYLEFEYRVNAKAMPYRDYLFDHFYEWESRATGIGICSITIIENMKRPSFFLMHRRSESLAEHPGAMGSFPAGSLEPIEGIETSDLIPATVYKELGEEMFSFSEKESNASNPNNAIFQLIKNTSTVEIVGFGIDPFTLKMEVGTILILNGEKLMDALEVKKREELEIKLNSFCNDEGRLIVNDLCVDKINAFLEDQRSDPITKQLLLSLRYRLEKEGIDND